MSTFHAVLKARIFLTIFIWLNATVFIKFFWDSSAAFMLGWYLYKGGVYLKSNLFLANNSMFVLKVIFYMVLNFRICMLILLQFILSRKILCRICFLDIRTGKFTRICIWLTQNFQLRSKHLSLCVFLVYCSNKRRIMMWRLFEGGVY